MGRVHGHVPSGLGLLHMVYGRFWVELQQGVQPLLGKCDNQRRGGLLHHRRDDVFSVIRL